MSKDEHIDNELGDHIKKMQNDFRQLRETKKTEVM